MSELSHIRNFSIIAHIDHGKSTLSDRFIQQCGSLSSREMEAQVLDSMELERERGITIKAQSVTLEYQARDGNRYQFNFIDTPGHVDFAYEVSRSLAACEGALLVVDAAQGVEAQSVANCYTAIDQGLEVIPVLNKIDLPQANPDLVCQQIETIIGLDCSQAIRCSAKTGQGIVDILEQLIVLIPPPQGNLKDPFKALIIDSWFDNYLGVVSLVRVVSGVLKRKDKIVSSTIKRSHQVEKIGIFTPKAKDKEFLKAGEVGFIVAGIKDIQGAPVGDTLLHANDRTSKPLLGFKKVPSQVYSGLFPVESNHYNQLREALEKLSLNDASLYYVPENSNALGFGFRCGFLGMLHLEIIQERLEREYNLNLISTAPTVVYEVLTKKGELLQVDNPSKLPDINQIESIREPICEANILVPQEHLGNVIKLCVSRRGEQKNMQFSSNQVSLVYHIPMSEVVMDFFDKLKSCSRGFASLEYNFKQFQKAPLVKLDILVNGDKVDALALIVHREQAYHKGHQMTERLKTLIPRQMFEVAIQAAVGAHIIARASISALRKNVLAKCYGGDVSRKRKLLEKQKAGKKRMKQIGRISIPQEAFFVALENTSK